MLDTIKRQWQAQVAVVFFVLLTVWWLINHFIIGNENVRYDGFFDIGEFYGYMAIWGGIWGVAVAKKWGGFKSLVGKAIYMFSFGLFAQEFGQLAYAWYNDIFKTPGPYPSIGDIGYFGSIPLYILGILYLAKASGATLNLQSVKRVLSVVIIPVVGLVASYLLFLQGYEFDWSKPLTVFLDFGYPLGQALYVSLAILAYILSHGVLGGVMKKPIRLLIIALLAQYLSDFSFLFVSSHGGYTVGSFVDYIYLIAYTVMTLGLLQLKTVFEKLKTSNV